MKILILILVSFSLIFFYSCASETADEVGVRVDMDVPAFKSKMTQPNTVILDVRTPIETRGGMIDGAIAINVQSSDFEHKIQELDKDKTYLVYCRSGKRSVKACKAMEKNGFENLVNLKGGYKAWKK